MAAQEPTEEELRAALEEQMRNLTVEDVVVQTVATLVNLAARRLGLTGDDPAEVDTEQARMGIDAVRALMPHVPQEQVEPLRQALSQLQMAFARQAGGAAGADVSPPRPGEQAPGPPPAEPTGEPAGDDAAAERARARSKIWTPPGSS